MASKTTLNAKNLEALGVERLAQLLIEISTGDAAAKRKLRVALAGATSPKEAAREIAKRLVSITDITVPWATLILSVGLYIVIPLAAGIVTRMLMTRGAANPAAAEAAVGAFTASVKPFSIVGLLATVVLLFGFQGAVILSQPLVIVMIAIPLLIQSYGIFAIAYWAAKAWRVPHNVAAPGAMIGTSNFFELAVAVAIGLFGLNSIAALVTVVGVLVEVPVMLSLVWFANRTRHWFPAEETPIGRASKTEKV